MPRRLVERCIKVGMCASVVERSITPRCRRGDFGLRGFESLPTHKMKKLRFCGAFFISDRVGAKCGALRERDSKDGAGYLSADGSRVGVTKICLRRQVNYL